MDSFRQFLGTEECSSSESGWTMYIASPMQEDDAGRSNNDNEEYEEFYGGNRKEMQKMKVDDGESDDSMASDASSGPIHGTMPSKRDKKNHGSKFSSQKNVASKQEKKRVDGKSIRK